MAGNLHWYTFTKPFYRTDSQMVRRCTVQTRREIVRKGERVGRLKEVWKEQTNGPANLGALARRDIARTPGVTESSHCLTLCAFFRNSVCRLVYLTVAKKCNDHTAKDSRLSAEKDLLSKNSVFLLSSARSFRFPALSCLFVVGWRTDTTTSLDGLDGLFVKRTCRLFLKSQSRLKKTSIYILFKNTQKLLFFYLTTKWRNGYFL